MSSIYLSYSRRDQHAMLDLLERLAARGYRPVTVDFDPEVELPAGRSWERELLGKLQEARGVLLVLSSHSISSPWTFMEVTQARALGKRILPVKVEPSATEGLFLEEAVVDLSGPGPAAYESLWSEFLKVGFELRPGGEWDAARAPYPGLLPFQEADAAMFFGREADSDRLRDLVERMRLVGGTRLLVVAGPSGSGKSSMVRAGVLARLRREPERWMVVPVVRAGLDPMSELAAGLGTALGLETGDEGRQVEALLSEGGAAEGSERTASRELREFVGAARKRAGRQDASLLVVVDEVEELLAQGPATARVLLTSLRRLVDTPGTILVLVMRNEHLGSLERVAPEIAPYQSFLVSPLEAARFRQVIESPAERAGLKLESGLVERLLAESAGPDGLALLAFSLRELYELGKDDLRLCLEHLGSRLGGVEVGPGRTATRLLAEAGLTPSLRAALPRSLVKLAHLQEGHAPVPRAIRWNVLDPEARPVFERLLAGRLLRGEGQGERRTVSVAHAVLLHAWPELREWLEEEREFLFWKKRLRQELGRHRAVPSAGRPRLGAGALQEAKRWERARPGCLAADEQAFVRASRLRERAGRLLRRLLVGGAALLALLALAGAGWLLAGLASRSGEARRLRATSLLRLAMTEPDPLTRALLAAELKGEPEPPGGAAALSLIAQTPVPLTAWGLRGDPLTMAAFDPDGSLAAAGSDGGQVWLLDTGGGTPGRVLQGHTAPVASVAFSPDGRRLLTASKDGTARVWDVRGKELTVVLSGHTGGVWVAGWSPDGAWVVTGSEDGTARVWASDGAETPVVLAGHQGPVGSARFSPDGRHVLTTSEDGTARLWMRDGSGAPVVLRGHRDVVWSGSFSPDGRRVVTASGDGTVRVWNADGSGQPVVLSGHEAGVVWAVFDPDGTRVLTASWDGTALVWNADGSGAPVVFRAQGRSLWTAAWSPDGRRILTVAADGVARLWDAGGVGGPTELRGPEGWTWAAWSPDGSRVLTASADGMARLWSAEREAEPGLLVWPGERLMGVAFQRDGRRLLGLSPDGSLGVWSPDRAPGPVRLGGVGECLSAALSPDAGRVAAGRADGTVQVAPVEPERGEPILLRGHEAAVTDLAFSRDGERLATASADRTARVWRTDGTGEPVVFQGHLFAVTAVDFSPDGGRIATASLDGTARVWKARGVGEKVVLRGHQAGLNDVAFSPDGTLVATGSEDGTARIWRSDGHGDPLVLVGHQAGVSGVAFSPDGKQLATSSRDGTVRVWPVAGTGEPLVLEGGGWPQAEVAWSLDGRRVAAISDEDGTARTWRVRWEELLGYLDRATLACLEPGAREHLLGEGAEEARERWAACEKRRGREARPGKG